MIRLLIEIEYDRIELASKAKDLTKTCYSRRPSPASVDLDCPPNLFWCSLYCNIRYSMQCYRCLPDIEDLGKAGVTKMSFRAMGKQFGQLSAVLLGLRL